MKKTHHLNNDSQQKTDPEENLLFAMAMGALGLFTGFLLWFITPAAFGISVRFHFLFSIMLAIGSFAFGLLQPEKAAHYIDQGIKFTMKKYQQFTKKNNKNRKKK